MTQPDTTAAYVPTKRHGTHREVRQWSEPRCLGCKRMLARLISAPARIDCPRCKETNLFERIAGHHPG